MRTIVPAIAAAVLALASPSPDGLWAQSLAEEAVAHVEAARAAAGSDHAFLFGELCAVPIERLDQPPVTDRVPGALPSVDPDRDWYAAPMQVFDNLFFLGQTRFSAWGVRTSEGVIIIDTIFDYSVEAEVVEGLRLLGIDPSEIRYVIVSHAHGDHDGGAGILQDLGARVIMSEADWELYESRDADSPRATRDIVATDGMELELGDTTLTIHLTPGHTHGTISTVIPVWDDGVRHTAAVWGGTLFNFRDSPDDPRQARLVTYAESAAGFREVAEEAGVDILLSNHTAYDGSTVKLPFLGERQPGEPHPYVIGTDAVSRFLVAAEECAIATRLVEQGDAAG